MIGMNYADPDDAVNQVNSFDNPNHIQLPANAVPGPSGINSATYNKRRSRNK